MEISVKSTIIQFEENILDKINGIAGMLNRPRSWVIKQAVERFIEYEELVIQEVNNGIEEVNQGKVATEKEVAEVLNKWGVDAP